MQFFTGFNVLLSIFVFLFVSVKGEIFLEHISTVYVPFSRNPDVFEFDSGVGEQIAVNPDFPYVYTVGGNLVQVLDYSDPESVTIVHYEEVFPEGEGSLGDITMCQDWVAVMVDNNTSPLDGRALVYTRYDATKEPHMELLFNQIVGAVPDSSAFTPGCTKLIVAVEGEPRAVNNAPVDPEGGAAILDFNGVPNANNGFDFTFADFKKFDASSDALIQSGVRKSYNGQGTSSTTLLSQDLEPENIALSYDGTLAYITLQENNAIAVLDIAMKEFISINPLGSKSYEAGNKWNNQLDASDKDDMINIANYPIHAFYQPDGFTLVRFNGKDYLITANEGDTREFTMDDNALDVDWTDAYRGDDTEFTDMLSTNVPADVRALLADDAKLGRLHFSVTDGLDAAGQVEKLYTFGGRSVSLIDIDDDFSVAYDTGADLEKIVADELASVFNSDADDNDTPEERFDKRSDNRGLEPEVVFAAILNDRHVIFTGIERPGMVIIHTLEQADDTSDVRLQYQSMYYGGGFNATFKQMYDEKRSHGLDIEDMRFISADDSPTGDAMLIVAGSVSGTVSFFTVVDTTAGSGNNGPRLQVSSFSAVLWLLLFCLHLLSSNIDRK